MDSMTYDKKYTTIKVNWVNEICYIQINRPQANNSINNCLVDECTDVLHYCEASAKIVVLEGLPDVFCHGVDFNDIKDAVLREELPEQDPEPLYNLWLQLSYGSFVSIAHIRGDTNAGGVGFAAACDIVLCEERATFRLSEMLFGLIPACVMPFLIRRIGHCKANYLTLTTQVITATEAKTIGLVDVCDQDSVKSLNKYLNRLEILPKSGIEKYKKYIKELDDILINSKTIAVDTNKLVFADQNVLKKIGRYVNEGVLPWEHEG